MSTEVETDMENDLGNEDEDGNGDANIEEETDEEITMTMILARMIESESSEERKLAEKVTKEEAPMKLRNVERERLKRDSVKDQ